MGKQFNLWDRYVYKLTQPGVTGQPDSLDKLCKYFHVYRSWRQSIRKEMKNDLKFAYRD